jgi:hypothetical protein
MQTKSSKYSKDPSDASAGHRNLSYKGSYACPICRHGQISELMLMDAFACNFCRHIFTANLQNQTIHVVDSSQPMSWRWNGRNWQSTYRDDPNLTLFIWIFACILVIVPPALLWLLLYLFPPLPNSHLAWFPSVWIGCTLASRVRVRQWIDRR